MKMLVSVGRTFAAAFKEDICRRGDNRGTCVAWVAFLCFCADWMVLGTDVGFQVLRTALLFLQLLCQVCERPVCLGRRQCLWPVAALPADFPVDLCHACPSDPPLAVPEGP